MDSLLCKYMNSPILVRLNADDVQLKGIKQYARLLTSNKDPLNEIDRILNSISYGQCLVFVNEIEYDLFFLLLFLGAFKKL